MYFPTILTASATVPFFATYLAETNDMRESDSLLTVAYICAVGLLISFAALLDDAHGLTAWFGLATDYGAFF